VSGRRTDAVALAEMLTGCQAPQALAEAVAELDRLAPDIIPASHEAALTDYLCGIVRGTEERSAAAFAEELGW
jgi:hypothetical protein